MPVMHRRAAAAARSIPAAPAKALPQPPRPSADARLSFKPELLHRILVEVTPLLILHHRELGYPGKFDPDWHTLLGMNALGRMTILTARSGSLLVGYITTRFDPSLFSRYYVEANIDLFYLAPAYRSGWDGYRMFQVNDKLIASRKPGKVYVTAPLTYQDGRIRSMFKRLGYTLAAEIWTK
jgi:hypothetical protein